MSERINAIEEKLRKAITLNRVRNIEGWRGVEAFAERLEIGAIEIETKADNNGKWFSRGIAYVQLFNWDDEQFGEIRLYFSAAGHLEESKPHIDALEMAQYEQ